MPPQRFPCGAYVPAPGNRPVPALPGPGGPGHVQHPLLRPVPAQALPDAPGMAQAVEADLRGIQVFLRFLRVYPHPFLVRGPLLPVPVALKGLRAVAPEGVDSFSQQSSADLVPVDFPGLRVKGVVGGPVSQHAPFPQQLLPVPVLLSLQVRPHGNHHPHVHPVNRFYKPLRKTAPVQLLEAPLPFRPGLPVLYDQVQGNLPPPVFRGYLRQFLRGDIPFLRLGKSQRVPGQHRGGSHQSLQLFHHGGVSFLSRKEIPVQGVRAVNLHKGAFPVIPEAHAAAHVEQDAPSFRGNQHRHHRLQVVLVQQPGAAPQVSVSLLMGPQAVQGFPLPELKMLPAPDPLPVLFRCYRVRRGPRSVHSHGFPYGVRTEYAPADLRLLQLRGGRIPLLQQQLSLPVQEGKGAAPPVHPDLQPAEEKDVAVFFRRPFPFAFFPG